MADHRIDVHLRVADSNEDITVNYNAGGNNTVTLTAGLYKSLALLCAEVQTQLQTVHASLTCTESDGVVTIAGTATFTITWDHPSLRDWLGWATNLSAANSYVAPSQSPGTFVATLPWETLNYGWMWTTKRWEGHHQTGGSIKLGKVSMWQVNARLTQTELDDEFRNPMSYLLQGKAARWWRNDADNTAWSYTNWDGFVDVILAGDMADYAEQWLNPSNIVLSAMVPLRFVVHG